MPVIIINSYITAITFQSEREAQAFACVHTLKFKRYLLHSLSENVTVLTNCTANDNV